MWVPQTMFFVHSNPFSMVLRYPILGNLQEMKNCLLPMAVDNISTLDFDLSILAHSQ